MSYNTSVFWKKKQQRDNEIKHLKTETENKQQEAQKEEFHLDWKYWKYLFWLRCWTHANTKRRQCLTRLKLSVFLTSSPVISCTADSCRPLKATPPCTLQWLSCICRRYLELAFQLQGDSVASRKSFSGQHCCCSDHRSGYCIVRPRNKHILNLPSFFFIKKCFLNWSTGSSKLEVIKRSEGRGTWGDKQEPPSHHSRMSPSRQQWHPRGAENAFQTLLSSASIQTAKSGQTTPNSSWIKCRAGQQNKFFLMLSIKQGV